MNTDSKKYVGMIHNHEAWMLGIYIVMSQNWSETYNQAFVKLLNSQIVYEKQFRAQSAFGSGCNNCTKQHAHLSSRITRDTKTSQSNVRNMSYIN